MLFHKLATAKMCAHTHMYTHTLMHAPPTHIHTHTHACAHAHPHKYGSTCLLVRTHRHTHTHMHVKTYTHIKQRKCRKSKQKLLKCFESYGRYILRNGKGGGMADVYLEVWGGVCCWSFATLSSVHTWERGEKG